MYIKNILAREILDSRGNPTVEAEIYLDNGSFGRASVPSGASTGSKEAHELRDQDNSRYFGKGVLKAVNNINTQIANNIIGETFASQQHFDEKLITIDNSSNKSNIGANAILALSLAFARARANFLNLPLHKSITEQYNYSLPLPMMNILNGGAHANNNLDIQEFMIIPIGTRSIADALEMGARVFHTLKDILNAKGLSNAVGDEGGFAPNLENNRHALDLILTAISKAGLRIKDDIVIALDIAASELYQDGDYKIENSLKSGSEVIQYYNELINNYPIYSIEDGIGEQDWRNWQLLTENLGHKVQLVGDDIFVTNPKILSHGIREGIANAILIKPNQIGTLTETLQTISIAKNANYTCVMSHRSGETEDTFIADLAVATGCQQIKTGSMCRTDRIAKYNQLLRIAESDNLIINNKPFNYER